MTPKPKPTLEEILEDSLSTVASRTAAEAQQLKIGAINAELYFARKYATIAHRKAEAKQQIIDAVKDIIGEDFDYAAGSGKVNIVQGIAVNERLYEQRNKLNEWSGER